MLMLFTYSRDMMLVEECSSLRGNIIVYLHSGNTSIIGSDLTFLEKYDPIVMVAGWEVSSYMTDI